MNIATLLQFPVKGLIALGTWGCLWLAVVICYPRITNVFLRRNLWTVPVFIAAMFVVGFVIELRIYGEVLPIVLAAAWVVFLDVIKESLTHGAMLAPAVEVGQASVTGSRIPTERFV